MNSLFVLSPIEIFSPLKTAEALESLIVFLKRFKIHLLSGSFDSTDSIAASRSKPPPPPPYPPTLSSTPGDADWLVGLSVPLPRENRTAAFYSWEVPEIETLFSARALNLNSSFLTRPISLLCCSFRSWPPFR